MKTNSYLAKILFCLLPAVSVNAYAKVAGSVMSSEGETLPGASVVLVSLPDSTLVLATLADANGKFSFDSAQPEGKALMAEFPGYEKGVCAAGEECGLILEPKVTGLKEVEVIAKGNDVRASAGKYVYTPGDMALKMSNAYTALSISPLIKEEKNKLSIFFKEAPAIVYINGKMPKESQESVLAMLRSVPPQNIIRIEVMPNPGMSQRDAWGGIINVVLKNPGDGVLGNVRYSGYMNDGRVASNLASYTAFQKDRFHSSLNIGYYGQNYRFSSRNVYNFFTDGSKASEWREESSHKNLLHALYDAAYELSGSSTIGGGVNISDFEEHIHSRITSTKTSESGNTVTDHSLIKTNTPFHSPSFGGYLYYNLRLDNRNSFFEVIPSAYMRPKYSSNRYQIIDGLYDNEQYSTETEGYTVYTKLNKNFSNGSTLTADASFDKNRNTEKHATNTLRDENFSLGQTNVIVSANYSFSLGKVNLSVGAQGWFNRMETSQRITNEDYTSNSFSLLPSASVSYAFRDGKSNLSISYYARQFLPRFSQLNPRRIVISDSKVYQGNPYLKPMRFHSLNLEYMLNPNIVFSIRGSKNQLTISKYTSEDNILIETLISEGRSEGFYFSPYYQNTFFRIWTVTLSPSLHYTHYKNPNDAVYNCHYWGWDFSVSSMVEFIPGKRWFLSCSYHYSGKERAPYQHKNAVQDLSVDIMKTFPFGLDVSASMIKKFVYGKERYFTTDTYSYTLLNKNVPVFTLNLSYTFGNRRVRSVRTKTSASYSD